MGYGENSWDVLRWLLAQRLFRRKVGQLPVGWFIYNFNNRVLDSLVVHLPWAQVVVGSNPTTRTIYGSMKPNRKGICGRRMGEIPNVGPNPTASIISTMSLCWHFSHEV